MRVTGLITQGAKRIGSPEYVKSYKVAYSDDGKAWSMFKVKDTDEDMVRQGAPFVPDEMTEPEGDFFKLRRCPLKNLPTRPSFQFLFLSVRLFLFYTSATNLPVNYFIPSM